MTEELCPELLEEIFLRLPLKSIINFKQVSKQWKSILESKSFVQSRRLMNKNNKKKKVQILAAIGNNSHGYFVNKGRGGDGDEVEIFNLRCSVARGRPSLACEGMVCISVRAFVNVLNPSTGQLLRFPSGPDPVHSRRRYRHHLHDSLFPLSPGNWAMGFGRDKVNGRYKIVRMHFDSNRTEILDIAVGQWIKLPSRPLYYVDARMVSACVNGSIYWLHCIPRYRILAFDLHTGLFRDVKAPQSPPMPSQIANLEGRLTLSATAKRGYHCVLKIWSMDPREETWSNTYTISWRTATYDPHRWSVKCCPLAVSKRGNLVFRDNMGWLLKYYPATGLVDYITYANAVSLFVEDLTPLPRYPNMDTSVGFHNLDHVPESRISKILKPMPSVLLSAATSAFVILRCLNAFSKS
ncbi:unnamed protein product [Cochlearia groenlandica]